MIKLINKKFMTKLKNDFCFFEKEGVKMRSLLFLINLFKNTFLSNIITEIIEPMNKKIQLELKIDVKVTRITFVPQEMKDLRSDH